MSSFGKNRHRCYTCRYSQAKERTPPEVRLEKRKAYRESDHGQAAIARAGKTWRQSAKGKAYDQREDVREYRNAKMRAYRARNAEKESARQAVRKAKSAGTIQPASKLACSTCGNKASSYHHHLGYAPEHHLDIIPLCKPCHTKAG